MPVLWHDDYILTAPDAAQQPPSQQQKVAAAPEPEAALIADLTLEELRRRASPQAAAQGRLLRVFKARDTRAWSPG